MADAEYRIKKSTLEGIGNAIRRKDGTSAKIPVPDLEGRIDAIQTGTDTSDATATATEIFKGKTAYLKGGKATGSFTIDSELTTQDARIAALQKAVKNKSGGVNVVPVTVTLAETTGEISNYLNLYYTDLNLQGQSISVNGKTEVVRAAKGTAMVVNVPKASKITGCGWLNIYRTPGGYMIGLLTDHADSISIRL